MAEIPLKVLFLCTGNSCRSQMAEGLINKDFAGKVKAKSAGVMPSYVNPYAVRVLDELGIDITHHSSKHIKEFADSVFDLVITLCDYAAGVCPVWPKEGEIVHMPFQDPIHAEGTDEEILAEYRRIRDLIRSQIGEFLKERLKLSESD